MFFSRHLYIVILCYVLLILGVAGTGLVLIVTHTGIIIGCLIIIISFFITGALVKRLNKSNAKLKLFFDAIEDKENMIQFNEYSGDREMNALSRSLNRINELLATAKSDSQKQEKFYYSLLEEIPSGIIAWNSEGKIILANSTALSLYNPQIQISAESETKRSIFREKDKTKRSKKESAQHSKSRNKSFVMTSVSAL